MFGAAMPETPIHENRQTLSLKDEIGFPKNRLPAAPARDAECTENLDERQLCRLVALSANKRHHLGAFRLCEDIGHSISGGLPSMFRGQLFSPLNFVRRPDCGRVSPRKLVFHAFTFRHR